MLADTPELSCIACMQTLHAAALAAARSLSAHLAARYADVPGSPEEGLGAGAEAARLRGPVSRLLLAAGTLGGVLREPRLRPGGGLGVPWQEVVVAVRWLHKAAAALAAMTAPGRSIHAAAYGAAVAATEPVLSSLSRLHSALSQHFHRPVFFEKLRLWREGGHSPVPCDPAGWALLTLMRAQSAARAIAAAGGATMPAFVEEGGSEAWRGHAGLLLIEPAPWRDWLALYATLYFQHTHTGGGLVSASSTLVPASAPLDLAKLSRRLDRALVLSLPEQGDCSLDDAFASTDDQKVRFLAVRGLQAIIDREEREGAALAVALLAEGRCLRAVAAASRLLSLLLLGALPAGGHGRALLRSSLAAVLGCGLSFTGLDPKVFREAQSLLWALEATDSAAAPHVSSRAALSPAQLGSLVRSCLPGLACLQFSLSSRALGNFVESLPLGYTSPTLVATLSGRGSGGSGGAGGTGAWQEQVLNAREAALSGPARLGTCLSLETVLRHVDQTALWAAASPRGPAVVTIKASAMARGRMLRLFALAAAPEDWAEADCPTAHPLHQLSHAGDEEQGQGRGQVPLGGLPSLAELVLLALDLGLCCRDLLPPGSAVHLEETRAMLAEEEREADAPHTAPSGFVRFPQPTLEKREEKERLLQAVARMHKMELGLAGSSAGTCTGAGPHPRELLAALFGPALALILEAHTPPVGNTNAGASSSSSAGIEASDRCQLLLACASTLLALLRAHLLLPQLPVDPALKPAVKASLLQAQLRDAGSTVKANSAALAIAGLPPTPEPSLVAHISDTSRRVKLLQTRVVGRPVDCDPFEELFALLRDGAESIASVVRVVRLLRSIAAATGIAIQSPIGSSAGNSLLAELARDGGGAGAGPGCDRLLQEEASWQAACLALTDRLAMQGAYEDVTAVSAAALHGVAAGLRVATGVLAARAGNKGAGTGAGAEGDSRPAQAAAWSALLSYPHSSLFCLARPVGPQAVAKLVTLGGLVGGSGSTSSSSSAASALPEAASPQASLLVLAHMDYLVATHTLPPGSVYAPFQAALSRFVHQHLAAQHRRRHQEALDGSLYRSRLQERVFAADDEKEEAVALREHFPDHLGGFKDLLNAGSADSRGGKEAEDSDGRDADIQAEEPPGETGGGASSAGVEGGDCDGPTLCRLVGLHARMVLLLLPGALVTAGEMWAQPGRGARGGGGSSSIKDITKKDARQQRQQQEQHARRLDLSSRLSQQALLVSSLLARQARRLLVPALESSVRGGCLNALALLAAHGSHTVCLSPPLAPGPPGAVAPRSRAALSAAPMAWSVGMDRDLRLLLEMESDAVPSFHTDPAPAEAQAAAPALGALHSVSFSLSHRKLFFHPHSYHPPSSSRHPQRACFARPYTS